MQRAAQREQRDRRDQREGRAAGAPRLRRAVVCATALPVLLLTAAACSSSSDSGSDDASGTANAAASGGASASATASPSPTVRAAVYGKLPDACGMLPKKTLGELVPGGEKSAKAGASSDVSTRASCSWNGLTNNGVKGSQYRWLNVSLLRFESDTARGSGEEQAREYYGKQVQDARTVSGARKTSSQPVSGAGDEATAVRYDLKKKEGTFKQQTVVARVENVVVTLDYNGAGLAGDKTPDAEALTKDAVRAAQEAVASVKTVNGAGGAGSSGGSDASSPSGKATGKASGEASGKASAPASGSASPSATTSPSESASKSAR
ncbi:DUF3558 domain-containing protein [Streptomyces sp. NPDC018057]|uniref:DUF3558 domain-containing protein n=1 Tax=unclassified Streptomyces TaxID=2593676 RepID=UPI0037A32B6F